MSILDSLTKMKDRVFQLQKAEYIENAASFAQFAAHEEFDRLLERLQETAMEAGLDATSPNEVLIANGTRKAYLAIIKDLKSRRERAIAALNADDNAE